MPNFEVYHKEDIICRVEWGDNPGIAHVQNFTGQRNIFVLPITLNEYNYDVPFRQAMEFLEHRCVPRTRIGINELLRKKYKLKEYDPLQICKQTHGVSMSDYIWVKFNDEETTWNDVKLRD